MHILHLLKFYVDKVTMPQNSTLDKNLKVKYHRSNILSKMFETKNISDFGLFFFSLKYVHIQNEISWR
jgi:hypothetical protein